MSDAINREDVIRMAKESGFKACVGTTDKEGNYHPFVNALGKDIPIEWLERFAALAALRAQPAGWIAVTERLPKEDMRVLTWYRGHVLTTSLWRGLFMTDSAEQPTHWMPLPPPPGQGRAQPDHIVDANGMVDHSELVAELQDLVDNGWIEGCKTTTRDIEEAILALT